jgi:hypothetical protein
MSKIPITAAAAIGGILVVILTAATPAVAITTELAKKCQKMAAQAYPTTPAGTTAYAAAQRQFFAECVSKNGDVDVPRQDGQSGVSK